MKNVIIFIAFVTVTTMTYAQTDTTHAQSKTWQSGTANYQDYPTKDMRKLNASEIPSDVRSTLQWQEYSGWEKGSVYFNSATNEYFYQPASNSATSLKNTSSNKNTGSNDKKNATWYRFDSKGRPLRDQWKSNE